MGHVVQECSSFCARLLSRIAGRLDVRRGCIACPAWPAGRLCVHRMATGRLCVEDRNPCYPQFLAEPAE